MMKLLILILIPLLLIPVTFVHADSRADCTRYDDGTIAKIQSQYGGGCEYVVTDYLKNGWHLGEFVAYEDCSCDIYILTK